MKCAMRSVRLLAWMTTMFPLWVVLGCGWAWLQPGPWAAMRPFIEPGLGLIMLGMGLTLRVADFAAVARQPKLVALGVAAQFLIMPFSGWAIAKGFQLEPGLATKHFPQMAMAPVPAAISAVFHCLIGSMLAAWWGKRGNTGQDS